MRWNRQAWKMTLAFAAGLACAPGGLAQGPVVSEAPPLLLPPEPDPAPRPLTTPSAPTASDEPARAFTPSPEFQEWITRLAREHLPHDYEKKKNWGHTTRAFDGVSVRLEDGQIKTHRKYKQANDGTWQMYRVELVDPEEKFEVRVANVRELEGGRVGMDISAVANLKVFGRQSVWEHGVQLYSLSADATARVRLTAHCEVAARLNPTRFPPDIVLDPEVTAARFDIPDFRLQRISRAGGPLVRSLSHTIREVLEDKLREDNEKIVAKLNKQIAKQEDKLTLSMADAVQSKLGHLLGPREAPAKKRPEANSLR